MNAVVILGKLGIDLKLLVAQIINFALLYWILKRFLYTPIVNRIEADEEVLHRAATSEKALQQEVAAAQVSETEATAQAREQAHRIVAEAEAMAADMKATARKEAQTEKRRVIKQIQARLKDLQREKGKTKK